MRAAVLFQLLILYCSHLQYKVDMDIAGTRNSMTAIKLENEKSSEAWYDEDWGKSEWMQKIVHRALKTEDDSAMEYGTNSGGMFVILNKDAKNAWGVERGVSHGEKCRRDQADSGAGPAVRNPPGSEQHPSDQPRRKAHASQRRVGQALVTRYADQGL